MKNLNFQVNSPRHNQVQSYFRKKSQSSKMPASFGGSKNIATRSAIIFIVSVVILMTLMALIPMHVRQSNAIQLDTIYAQSLPSNMYTELLSYEVLPLTTDGAKSNGSVSQQPAWNDAGQCDGRETVFETTYLALVVNVASKRDDVSVADVSALPLYVYADLSSIFTSATVVPDVYVALDSDVNAVGIVLFEDLKPQYRVLTVGNQSLFGLNRDGSQSDYPLYLINRMCLLKDIVIPTENRVVQTNRDLSKLLTVTQTGVTAISRGLASKIEKDGRSDYPALKIAEYLKNSDISHTSNEVSFFDSCVPSFGSTMVFCAKTKYFDTLKTAGIDIIELTGNHNNDYGSQYSNSAIDLYESAGMEYFGGGRNLEDAEKILYVEEKGTKIAFIGYNFYDAFYGYQGALAGEEKSGANPYSDEKLETDVVEAQQNADVVIVDFQFQECWCYNEGNNSYCYYPISYPSQEEYFKKAMDLGADIVVGSQAHMPQIIENYNDGVIFYGLGNLWFDQINWEWTKQGMLVTHIFYDGQYLSSVVNPTYYDNTMQVYLAEGEKREEMLDIYYQRD